MYRLVSWVCLNSWNAVQSCSCVWFQCLQSNESFWKILRRKWTVLQWTQTSQLSDCWLRKLGVPALSDCWCCDSSVSDLWPRLSTVGSKLQRNITTAIHHSRFQWIDENLFDITAPSIPGMLIECCSTVSASVSYNSLEKSNRICFPCFRYLYWYGYCRQGNIWWEGSWSYVACRETLE